MKNMKFKFQLYGALGAVFVTWLGVYPVLTVLALMLDPYLNELRLPIRTLVLSLIMVPMMVLLIMPGLKLLTASMKNYLKNRIFEIKP